MLYGTQQDGTVAVSSQHDTQSMKQGKQACIFYLCGNYRLNSGASASIPDSDGLTALHKAAQQACVPVLFLVQCICLHLVLVSHAKDEYYNTLTLKLERKMQKFDLRLMTADNCVFACTCMH